MNAASASATDGIISATDGIAASLAATMADAVRSPSVDLMAVLASLAAECSAACLALDGEPPRWREAVSLRQCAREIALLVDACGGDTIVLLGLEKREVVGAVPGYRGLGSLGFGDVVGRFRSATEVPMPRALCEALRLQLSRLEQVLSVDSGDTVRAA